MKIFASVNSEGEVLGTIRPAVDSDFTHGQPDPHNSSITFYEIPLEIANTFHRSRYYWGEGGWQTRTLKPSNHHFWRDTSWMLNETSLWEEIRQRRDALLASCDWTQLPDAPLSEEKRASWNTYRQNLRDIPQDNVSPTFVTDINWPTKP